MRYTISESAKNIFSVFREIFMSAVEISNRLNRFLLQHNEYLKSLDKDELPEAWQIKANRLCHLIISLIDHVEPLGVHYEYSFLRGHIEDPFNLNFIINRVNTVGLGRHKEWDDLRAFLLEIPHIQLNSAQQIQIDPSRNERDAQEQFGFLAMNIYRA